MRLTVGPLPPAVYWRRRAIVLGALLLVGFLSVSRCSTGSSGAVDTAGGTTGSPSPTPSSSLLTPIVPSNGAASASATASAQPRPSGPCGDGEIEVTVATAGDKTEYAVGASINLFLNIENISDRSCARDVGGAVQEMRIVQGAQKVWSSDDCAPPGSSNGQTLAAGERLEISNVTWNGRASTSCQNRQPPAPGTYQLIGRVDTKWSEPLTLTLTAAN